MAINLAQLKAQIDELIEKNPATALALAQRIQRRLQSGFPQPLVQLHQELVQRMLSPLSEEELTRIRKALEEKGFPAATVEQYMEQIKHPGLKAGQSFGGLHLEDVLTYLEVLFHQGAGRFILGIEFENPDDDHLTLTIKEISKAYWQKENEDNR